jgi:hypothetical protein
MNQAKLTENAKLAVTELVKDFLHHDDYELEVRCALAPSEYRLFENGIVKQGFDNIMATLKNSGHFQRTDSKSWELIYNKDGVTYREIRDETGEITLQFMRKESKREEDLQLRSGNTLRAHKGNLRVSLAQETVLDLKEARKVFEPSHASSWRGKNRVSFTTPGLPFRIDMTEVKSGRDMQSAVHIDASSIKYQIEMELLHNEYLSSW